MSRIANAACSDKRTAIEVRAMVDYAYNGAPDSLIPSVLPVFYSVLDTPIPVAALTSSDAESLSAKDKENIICATVAIQGVRYISEVVPSTSALAPYLWQRVWPWSLFIHAHWLVHPERDMRRKVDCLLDVVRFAEGCVANKVWLARIEEVPELWVFVGELWANLKDLSSPQAVFNATTAINRLLFDGWTALSHLDDPQLKELPKDETIFPGLLEGAGGSLKHLVKAVIAHFKLFARTRSPLDPAVLWYLHHALVTVRRDLISAASRDVYTVPSLRDNFNALLHGRRYTAVLTRLMVQYTGLDGRGARASDHSSESDPLNVCHDALAELFCMSRKRRIIIPAAIEAGFLRLVAIWATLFAEGVRLEGSKGWGTEQPLNEFVQHHLTLTLYSVPTVRALRRALAEDEQLKRLVATEAFLASPNGQDWSSRTFLFENRIQLLTVVESADYTERKACDNIQCGLMVDAKRFVRCVCKTAYYCSRTCQIRHWKFGGHRDVCGVELPQPILLCPASFGATERTFLRALIHQDYERNKIRIYVKQLRLLIQRGVDCDVDFFTLFDYSEETASPGAIPRIGIEAVDHLDELIRSGKVHLGALTLKEMSVRVGRNFGRTSVKPLSSKEVAEVQQIHLCWARRMEGMDALCLRAGIPVPDCGVPPFVEHRGLFQIHLVGLLMNGVRYFAIPLRSSSARLFHGLRELAKKEGVELWDDGKIWAEVKALVETGRLVRPTIYRDHWLPLDLAGWSSWKPTRQRSAAPPHPVPAVEKPAVLRNLTKKKYVTQAGLDAARRRYRHSESIRGSLIFGESLPRDRVVSHALLLSSYHDHPSERMPEFDGFNAWITIDGQRASEYQVVVSDDKQTVTCWVASQLGKTFSVEWKNESNATPHATVGYVKMDGAERSCGGSILYKHDRGAKTATVRGVREENTPRPFVFSLLETTDDDAFLDAGSSHSAESLGEIRLKITPIRIGGEFKEKASWKGPETLKVHERSKKAVTQQVGLGAPEPVTHSGTVDITYAGSPLVTFIWKYRSLGELPDVLRADGIAPQLKRKAEDEPSASGSKKKNKKKQKLREDSENMVPASSNKPRVKHEKDDEEDQFSRSRGGSKVINPEKGPKRSRSSVVIDLT
ncbi:hypothetical protein MKEN_01490800 [Mycena kentingensis (nom. inval.)]|nr:hypothetical protein MKEN_01490800 [Mycena kentingensis (nom. inval.)]